jgi:2'-5' RNA ligase
MVEREAVDDDWHRCFIALVPDAATRDAQAALPVAVGARRVPLDQLHMTLAFLGSVAPDQGLALARELSSVVVPLPRQRAEGSEYWPNAAHPRLVVVPFGGENGLADLEARVRELVAGFGLPVDTHRPFRPHITLARFSRSVRPARESVVGGAIAAVTPRFDALTLYSSTLARHGARYRPLARAAVPPA